MASSDPPSGRDREVIAGLPNARPTRRSAKRDRPARGQRAAGATAAPPKSGAKAAPKAKEGAPRSTAKTGTPRSTAKTGAARSAAKPGARRAAAPKVAPIPPAGYATPNADEDGPRGADLVTTVVQAAGELAQIGISAGGRALKAALERLPRP
jgi:hypothetical protein